MNGTKPLRFHWSLSQAGNPLRRGGERDSMPGVPDFAAQLALCRRAEESGVESMLMAIGYTRPDPLLLALALGLETERIKFMVACRAGLLSPVAFVRQVDTAAALLAGRICLNMVVGHTPKELGYYGCFLSHDERFEQMDEFLSVCRSLWEGGAPEIFIGGNSEQAVDLAVRHASCLWRFPEPPEELAPRIAPLLAAGTEVGLIASLVARPTREEAVRHAEEVLAEAGGEALEVHRRLERATDSVAFSSAYRRAEDAASPWLTRCLWTGAVPYLGPPATALVGSTEEIVETLLEYRSAGVTQFLLLGWPDLEEMAFFGAEVLPRLRRSEAACH